MYPYRTYCMLCEYVCRVKQASVPTGQSDNKHTHRAPTFQHIINTLALQHTEHTWGLASDRTHPFIHPFAQSHTSIRAVPTTASSTSWTSATNQPRSSMCWHRPRRRCFFQRLLVVSLLSSVYTISGIHSYRHSSNNICTRIKWPGWTVLSRNGRPSVGYVHKVSGMYYLHIYSVNKVCNNHKKNSHIQYFRKSLQWALSIPSSAINQITRDFA